MEEAYTALYQEFLRLQLLCMKQAAMLQHLTQLLRQQQGGTPTPNQGHEHLVSLPVHYRPDDLGTFIHHEPPASVAPSNPPCTIPTGDAVIGGMMRLQIDAVPENGAWGVNPPKHNSIMDELRQAEQRWYSSQLEKPTQRPWSSSFLNSEMLSEAGGMLMSRVTLQSRVCEFCHAVFPGHTTTRGEFLRHLTSHIS